MKQKTKSKLKICSRGHRYRGSGPCPVCWPGRLKKEHVVHHKDGSVWGKGKMLAGKPDGYWMWFRKDGTKMRSGYFIKGKQAGKWTTYDKGGGFVKVTDFDRKKSKK